MAAQLFPAEILEIKNRSSSLGNFAVNLMLELFEEEELLDEETNITGRPCGQGPPKIPLDPVRINEIRAICLSYVPSKDFNVRSRHWAKMRDAMSKKLSQLRRDHALFININRN